MTKNEFRKKYKDLRSKLSLNEVDNFSIAIANNLLQLPIWENDFYHVFLSIVEHKEVNTEFILSILSGKDKHIVLSQSDFKTSTMHHFLLTDSTLIKTNKWNIPEPVDGIEIQPNKIDVVFIPLLAFDKQGNRVGYGKGFYDKFLTECNSGTIKIGLSFFEAEDQIKEVFESDVQLNYCITPEQVYKF